MDIAAFRQMLAKAKQLEKKKEKNREKNEAQAAARGGKPGAADAGGYRDRANERRKEANPDYDGALTQMVALDVEESWEWTGLRIRSSVADYTSRAPAPQIRVFEGRPRRRAATPRRSRRRPTGTATTRPRRAAPRVLGALRAISAAERAASDARRLKLDALDAALDAALHLVGLTAPLRHASRNHGSEP